MLVPVLALGGLALLAMSATSTTPAVSPPRRPASSTGDPVYDKHAATLDTLGPAWGDRTSSIRAWLAHFRRHLARYEAVASRVDMPADLIAAIHWREGAGRFDTYLHNGQPLGQRTTLVPVGILFHTWEDAAVDALESHRHHARGITADTTDIALIATFAEHYNGLGYHYRNRASAYVYAGSDAYTAGKFVQDGVFDANHVDRQLGVVPMLLVARGTWALPHRLLRHGAKGPDVEDVQRALLVRGHAIEVDGHFGNATSEALLAFQRSHRLNPDACVGPLTRAALGLV